MLLLADLCQAMFPGLVISRKASSTHSQGNLQEWKLNFTLPHLLGRIHALTRLITWTLNSQVWADLVNVFLYSNIVPI